MTYIYTVSQKTCDYIFCNNFNNKCPIAIIFGIVISKSMRHRKIVHFAERCLFTKQCVACGKIGHFLCSVISQGKVVALDR